MTLTPDQIIMFTAFGMPINATIFYTWVVMGLLTVASIIITWNLRPDVPPNRWRTALEVIVQGIQGQIAEIAPKPSRPLLYFAGTLFLFVAISNLLLVIPSFEPPTSSLSTTTALAISVLIAELLSETRSVRQNEITTELLDVIVGFEALKGRKPTQKNDP